MSRNTKQPLDGNVRLMLKTADGDIEAFDRLFQRFAPLLMHLFVRQGVDLNSAEDFVQKIFTSLWEQRKNYRPVSSFETYLFQYCQTHLEQGDTAISQDCRDKLEEAD